MRYSLVQKALAASALIFSSANTLELEINNEDSIRNTAATVAYGLMANYQNNQSTTPANDVGTFAMPVYWWNSGAIWGGMVDYAIYTGDESYTETVSNALAANIGEKADLILESKRGQEGNDDQAFWALSIMSAAEANFPVPEGKPAWKDVCANAFDNLVSRWDTNNCGGGLFWQMYAENFHGLKYKNSVANGGAFQLAARLAILTKEQKYIEWANRIWDWSKDIGFIGDDYTIYDGAGIEEGCTKIDQNTWTYNAAMFTYGAAAMYSYTNDATWLERTNGLVKSAGRFFDKHDDAPNVMTELVCEHLQCNMDQQSFKAYLSRWLGKTSVLVPETAETIRPWLEASAQAAAKTCTGENNACGTKWYQGGFDGLSGVNQQLCAMEVIQSLLVSREKMYGQTNQETTPPTETPEVPETPASSEIPAPPAPSAAVPSPPPAETAAPAPSSEAPPAPEPTSEPPAPSEEPIAEGTAVLPTAADSSTLSEETAAESFCSVVTVTETHTESSTVVAPVTSIPVETPTPIVTISSTPTSLVTVQPPAPSSVLVGSSTVLPTIPTRTPSTSGAPTPTPTRFEGAAAKGKVSGGMYGVLGSIIAIAMFL